MKIREGSISGFQKPEKIFSRTFSFSFIYFFLLSPLPHSLSPKYPSPHKSTAGRTRSGNLPCRRRSSGHTQPITAPVRLGSPSEAAALPANASREACDCSVSPCATTRRPLCTSYLAHATHGWTARQATLCQQLAQTRRTRGDPGAHPAQARRGPGHQPRPRPPGATASRTSPGLLWVSPGQPRSALERLSPGRFDDPRWPPRTLVASGHFHRHPWVPTASH